MEMHDHYQKDIAFLKTDSLLDGFLLYYNAHHTEQFDNEFDGSLLSKSQLLAFIDAYLQPDPDFSYPKLVKINKMGSKKQRIVFVFPPDEQILLKYLNFAINTLPLDIHPNCYSFQRGVRITDAIRALREKQTEHLTCIKIDITDYFNSIDTSNLNSWLPQAVCSHAYLTFVIAYLLHRDEVMLDGECVRYEKRGVIAGMPLAPTLSNLYLRSFDEMMSQTYPCYARYSDDILIFTEESRKNETFEHIKNELNYRGLAINEKKTKVYQPHENYEFLGLSVCADRVDLSSATIEKIKGKISRQVRTLYRWRIKNHIGLEKTAVVMNTKFNRKFYGEGASETDFTWSKYFFSVLTTADGLKTIDRYYQEAIRALSTGRFGKLNYKHMPYKMLKESGYRPLVTAWYDRYKI